MSHLVNLDAQIQLEHEESGYQFGYYTFYPLPETEATELTKDTGK